jgi:hypothetical protein
MKKEKVEQPETEKNVFFYYKIHIFNRRRNLFEIFGKFESFERLKQNPERDCY